MRYIKKDGDNIIVLGEVLFINGVLRKIGDYEYEEYASNNGYTMQDFDEEIPSLDGVTTDQVHGMTGDEKSDLLAKIVKIVNR